MSTDLEVITDPVLRAKITRAEMHHPPSEIAPMAADQMKRRYDTIQTLIRDVLEEGKDYGTIPGAGPGKVLFKPGAEKLGVAFGLVTSFATVSCVESWETGLFHYEIRCDLHTRHGELVGSANGSCNTRESKYRYRWVTKPKPKDAALVDDLINRGMAKLKTNQRGEWYQERVENPDIFDVINTVQKMAAKRAHVAAIRIALGVSDLFDVEEADEPEERQPSTKDLENKAKAAVLAAVQRATGVDKQGAKGLAQHYWEEAALRIPVADEDLHALLVDIALSAPARAAEMAPAKPEATSSAGDAGASDFARALGQLLRGVAGPVDVAKERLLGMDEATQSDWMTALREADADGRASMVADLAGGAS